MTCSSFSFPPMMSPAFKLKNVLKKGPDTIADRSASFGYSGGTLIDLNVSKGFSTGQIDEWLDDPFLRNAIQNV